MTSEELSNLVEVLRAGISALRLGDLREADLVAVRLHKLLIATGSGTLDLLAHDAVEEFIVCTAQDRPDWERAASAFNALVFAARPKTKKGPAGGRVESS